jgi:DNA-binding NarL/FixJ family response regulator
LKPDLVLLDLRLPDGQGLDLIRDLCVSHPGLRILVLSEHDESVYAHRALQAGARGYLMKGEAAQTALEAIQAVLRGDIFVSRTVSARLLHSLFPDPASRTPDLAHLSERELQVFQLLGAGCGSHDIAKQLRISPKTVDTYRERLKDKLHLPDARALLLAALRWVERGRLDVS